VENPYLGGPRTAQHPRSSSSGEGKVSRRRRSTRSEPGGSNGGAPWLWGLPERQPGGGSSSSSNAALQQRMGGSRVLIPSRGGEAARPQESSERSARALTTCRRTCQWRVRPLAGGGCSGPNARARHQTRTRAGSEIWFVSPPPLHAHPCGACMARRPATVPGELAHSPEFVPGPGASSGHVHGHSGAECWWAGRRRLAPDSRALRARPHWVGPLPLPLPSALSHESPPEESGALL
jgi:hypothetical protein